MTMALKPPCDAAIMQHAPPARPCKRDAGPWILAATILASSMVFIDGSVVNLALPALQTNLHATIIDVQWVIEGYALFFSALILVGGSLGDQFGRRRIFLIGVIFFAAASAACGASQNAGQLIVARSFQGIASALLTPGSLAIISASFSDEQRGKAIGIWSSFTSIATAGGPILGGWIIQHASWRWIFFINIPLAAAVIALAARCVPESKDEAKTHHLDWGGALLATAGLGGIIYALISASGSGWTRILAGSLALGFLLLLAFIWVEDRVRAPMMPRELFAVRNFSVVNLITLLLYAALGGALFFLPFDLIQVQHYSPTAAGAAYLPFIGLMFLLSPWAGNLANSVGPKIPLVIGPFIAAAGFVLMALPGIGGSYWLTFFPAIVALGFGIALAVAPLTATVMGSVQRDRVGIASGINNAIARTAGLLAVALLSLAVVGSFNRSLDHRLAAISPPAQVMQAINEQRPQLAAAQAPAFASKTLRSEIQQAIMESYVSGFRLAVLIGAGLALASGLCATALTRGSLASARELRSS